MTLNRRRPWPSVRHHGNTGRLAYEVQVRFETRSHPRSAGTDLAQPLAAMRVGSRRHNCQEVELGELVTASRNCCLAVTKRRSVSCASDSSSGWARDMFTLGPFCLDRAKRRVWFAGKRVHLPPGALFHVLLALSEAWSDSVRACTPVPRGAVVRVANGRSHRLGYDDVNRLRAHFPCRDLIETVHGAGYRLKLVAWPPVRSGIRRAVSRR
jgi:DNA-binding response OmpR family regulator